jgi:hypothetical protein
MGVSNLPINLTIYSPHGNKINHCPQRIYYRKMEEKGFRFSISEEEFDLLRGDALPAIKFERSNLLHLD